MSRLTPVSRDSCTPEQGQVFDAITGGKRSAGRAAGAFLAEDGALRGPFNAMVLSPKAGLVLQRLGEILRFEGALDDRARELAILVVAARWKARFEWWAHARIAREAGIGEDVLDALAGGREPQLDSPELAAVYAYAHELVHQQRASDAVYAQARDALGEAALVELTIVLGYYTTVSMILNGFEVPLPRGERTPFDAR